MEEKQIAEAIQSAQKLHEESYNKEQEMYELDWESCFITACKEQKLPESIWYVLCLANHWYNDIQLWADTIVAGKDMNVGMSPVLMSDESITSG